MKNNPTNGRRKPQPQASHVVRDPDGWWTTATLASLAGVSVRKLARLEKSDPNFPPARRDTPTGPKLYAAVTARAWLKTLIDGDGPVEAAEGSAGS